MDLRDLIKLAGIVNPEVLNRIQPTAPEADCGCSMEEAEGAGFERATTEPEEEIYDDPLASLGSTADLSLRRYLKAKGDHVTVDENVYPDYTVEDVSVAYTAFKESKERPYVAVHAKKGKTEVTGSSSYDAAKKAAEKWGMKSTAGIDVHLADKEKVATEAKDYGPGKIGAIQKMLDKERDAKKAKIDQPAGITLSDWQAIAARKEELMDAGMEPEEAQDQAAEEMGIDPEELVDWLDANDDLYEAEDDDDRDELTKKLFPRRSREEMEKSDRERNRKMNQKRFMKPGKPSRSREWGAYEGVNEAEDGTYMKQWYNYSEDYAMLELYVDGKLVDKWDGYFGANETGNPLQVKFIEMAKENEVDPVGLKVIDGEDGDEGVFTSSGLKWNSNEATESLNDIKKLAGIAEADDDNSSDQDYFERVAVELGNILGKPVTLQDYKQKYDWRSMEFVIDGEPLEMFQAWRHDGTPGKPVTYFANEELGRFGIWWDNPADYADDLANVLQSINDEKNDDMDDDDDIREADLDENAFNQAAAAAARAGKDSFEFNGKTYKTKMDKSTAHKLDDDVDMLRKLAGLAR